MRLTIPTIENESQLIISSKCRTEFSALFENPEKLHSNFVCVKGPSGCGKDSMIRFYAKKYGYTIRLDREIEAELEAQKLNALENLYYDMEVHGLKQSEGISYVKIFCDVIERISFERQARKRTLYYMRDIPQPHNSAERDALSEAFHKLSVSGKLSIVPVWPIKFHPSIIMISTVHTNQTAIEKALLGVLQASDVNLPSDRVKAISKLANCDMSVALNLLSLTPKLRKSMLNEESVQKDLSDANLFHRLGKVMYNKRKNVTPKAAGEAGKKEKEEKDTIRYEGKEFDKYKSQHYFDPLDLIRRQNNFSRLSQRDFRGLVFENYLDFVGDVADVSKICHEFARIDKYDRCLFFDRDETLKASWDEYISFLYVLAFMNNARTDNHDRKRLFNFQYPKFMEKKLREYLPKYDYFKVDKSLLGDAEQVEAVADDIDENPEDDISIDYEENARFNSGFGYSNNKLKAEELDELDDIEAMVTGTSKASELVCEKGVAPKREYEGASSSLLRKSQEDEHELQDLDEEEMLAELNDLVFQHKSSTTVVAKAKKSPKSCVVSQMDIESELNDIL